MKTKNKLMKKQLIILGLFLFKISILYSCSCERIYYCDYLSDSSEVKIFIKGKVLGHKEYSEQNIAVYIEVLETFRDDVGVTDTLKLFGGSSKSDCKVNPYRFQTESEIYLGLGLTYSDNPVGYEAVDPDLEQDKYWSYGMLLCTMIKLKIEDDIVRGSISENEIMNEYPLEIFESRLESCSFSEKELNNYRCNSDNFIVYPNPSNGEEINLRNDYFYTAISIVNIYSIDGKLKQQLDFSIEPFQKVKFKLEESGIYILEIFCEGNLFYKKVVVKK